MTGERLALLVAADQFADPQLSALQAPQADISALAELLSDPEIGGFTVEQLVNCTSQQLRLALNRLFSHRDPDDFCLLHVSSHGLKDPSGELYLATADTQREYLEATSLDATYLRRQMDHSRAGAVVVLLDCCYGGAFERGMITRGDSEVDLSGTLVPVTEGRGRAVITASTAIEYAFEGTELRPGANPVPSIFTEAVVAGIRQGPADVDSNGVLTLSELFTFVSRRVRQRSVHQTPQWWLYGMSGELVIARNPNPIITPKDLPDDVAEVLRLPQAAARLGAVYALRRLVTEGDPGSALTAYRTLETLAVDDSRQVSTAAAEVLAGTHTTVRVRRESETPTPSSADAEAIDFGSVAVGQDVPPALIELGGTLAGVCKLEIRDAPIELTRRGLRAEVRLGTSTAASVDGLIEVVGPGGGAVVRVLAQIGADADGRSGLATEADIAVEAGTTVGSAVDSAVAPSLLADRARSQSKLSLDVGLLIVAWVVAIGTALAGLIRGPYSGKTWYEWLEPNLSSMSALATPAALLGLTLARSARTRLVMAVAVVGTGVIPVVTATVVSSVVYKRMTQELAVELLGALLVVGLGLIMAVRAGRSVSSAAASPSGVTTIAVTVLALILGIGAAYVTSGLVIAPLGVGVSAISGLLGIGLLLLPFQSRGRVAFGAFLIALLLTVTLYTLTAATLGDAALLPVGCVIYSAVVFFHIRPFWRALDAVAQPESAG